MRNDLPMCLFFSVCKASFDVIWRSPRSASLRRPLIPLQAPAPKSCVSSSSDQNPSLPSAPPLLPSAFAQVHDHGVRVVSSSRCRHWAHNLPRRETPRPTTGRRQYTAQGRRPRTDRNSDCWYSKKMKVKAVHQTSPAPSNKPRETFRKTTPDQRPVNLLTPALPRSMRI